MDYRLRLSPLQGDSEHRPLRRGGGSAQWPSHRGGRSGSSHRAGEGVRAAHIVPGREVGTADAAIAPPSLPPTSLVSPPPPACMSLSLSSAAPVSPAATMPEICFTLSAPTQLTGREQARVTDPIETGREQARVTDPVDSSYGYC
jgi:hypothetical protein